MKVFFTWFQDPKRLDFQRMKNVFIHSLKKHAPDVDLIELKTEYPKQTFNSKAPSHFENVYKLGIWKDALNNSDTPILLIDCDMLILKDISVIENMNLKDITLTTRREKQYTTTANCNAGFIYIKPTQRAKEFFEEWYNLSLEFDPKKPKWASLYKKYLGATQTTLGYIRESGKYEDIISELPCYIWNCANLDYPLKTDDTKVLHIKSKLRKHILNKARTTETKILQLADLWFKEEQEMISKNPLLKPISKIIKKVENNVKKIRTYKNG